MKNKLQKANDAIAQNAASVNGTYCPAFHSAPPIGWVNDPNFRAPLWKSADVACEALLSIMRYANILKLSEDEALLLSGKKSVTDAAFHLLACYPNLRVMLVTMGAEGNVYCLPGGETECLPACVGLPIVEKT